MAEPTSYLQKKTFTWGSHDPGSYSNAYKVHLKLMEVSTDQSKNTSRIYYKLYATSGAYNSFKLCSHGHTIILNDIFVEDIEYGGYSNQLTLNRNSSVTISEGYVNIQHYIDGTLEYMPVSFSMDMDDTYYEIPDFKYSAEWTLTPIDRKFTVKYRNYYAGEEGAWGAGVMPDLKVTYGVNTPLSANKFTRTGYHFTKWKARKTVDGTNVYKGYNSKGKEGWYEEKDIVEYYWYQDQSIVYATVPAGQSVIMWAQWETNRIDVKYLPNGGTIDETQGYKLSRVGTILQKSSNIDTFHQIKYSSSSQKLDTYNDSTFGLTRIGYTFGGWEVVSSGEVLDQDTTYDIFTYVDVDDSSQHILSTDIVECHLSAHWIANNYNITLDPNEGSVSINSVQVTYDSDYSSLPTPTRIGYTFNGWSTSRTGGTVITSNSIVRITEDTTLYAQWTANSYTITLDPTGGTVSTTSKVVTYNSTYGTLPNPTRLGYNFLGWYTLSDEKIESSDEVLLLEDITLYAHWVPSISKYEVRHYVKDIRKDTYTVQKSEVKEGPTDSTLILSELVMSSYGFSYTHGLVGDTSVTSTTILSDNSRVIKLYYDRNSYRVSILYYTGISDVSGAGTYEYGEKVTIIANCYPGYHWSEWIGDVVSKDQKCVFTMPEHDIQCEPLAEANTVIIKYFANGGTIQSEDYEIIADNISSRVYGPQFHSGPYREGSKVDPYAHEDFGLNKRGYVFLGWKVQSTGEILESDTPYDLTVYADHTSSDKHVLNTTENSVICHLIAVWESTVGGISLSLSANLIDSSGIGLWLQGYCKARLVAAAKSKYGDIVSYSWSTGDQTKESITTALTTPGKHTWTCTVTDSVGSVEVETISVDVLPIVGDLYVPYVYNEGDWDLFTLLIDNGSDYHYLLPIIDRGQYSSILGQCFLGEIVL